MKRIPLIITFLFPFCLLAQKEFVQPKRTFEQEFKRSFRTKPKLDVKLDNRFSFIRNNDVKTLGIKVGLNFRHRFKVGIGINQLLVGVKSEAAIFDEVDPTTPVELEYFYFSPYIEHVFHRSKRWEFSLATQLGFGRASYQYDNTEGEKEKLVTSTVLSYEPAMLIDYKIVRWVGIGTGIGYRLIYYKSPGVKERFSSPEYILKLKIYLGEIVRTITGKELNLD